MQPSGPYTITLGQTINITPPGQSPAFDQVVLANLSPFAIAVYTDGPAQWLQPWTADTFPVAGGSYPEITAALTSDPTGQINTGAVTATWYLATDTLDAGSYPLTLSPQGVASITQISGDVTLAAGTSIDATLTGPVTLAAGSTVSIGGTPNVAITGTPTFSLAAGASISIAGTPTVAITGTPTVTLAAGATVAISGTPAVTLSGASTVAVSSVSGNVSIENTAATSIFNQPLTTLVASGSFSAPVPAAGDIEIYTIGLTNVPNTTRSLLVLITPSSTPITGFEFLNATVWGSTSMLSQTVAAFGQNGQAPYQPISLDNGLTPIYVPFYGQIDSAGQIELQYTSPTNSGTTTFNYWVLALPDADINGSPISPINTVPESGQVLGTYTGLSGSSTAVNAFRNVPTWCRAVALYFEQTASGSSTANITVAGPSSGNTPLYQRPLIEQYGYTQTFQANYEAVPVIVPWEGTLDSYVHFNFSSGTGTWNVTAVALPEQPPALHLPPSYSHSQGVSLTTSAQQIVAAPATGYNRIVDAVSTMGATAGDAINWGINATAVGGFGFAYAAMSPFAPGWIVTATSAGIYVANSTAARGYAYASYHDEPIPYS